MSIPKISDIHPDICITRKDAINIIIASVAMEELALAHILNAEGEKLQYVLGTLDESKPVDEITICDIMAVNKSIQKTLRDVIKEEMLLSFKLEDAIEFEENGDECHLTIYGQKTWIDDNASKRPESVKITLYRDGMDINKTVNVASNGDGKFTFSCLPIWKNDTEKYVYTVDETDVPEGYKKTVEGYNITNTSLTRTISGKKVWENDAVGDRPQEISIALLQNGEDTGLEKKVASGDNPGLFSFPDMPRFDNTGVPYVYTVDEIEELEPKYKKTIDGFTITNTLQ